MPDPEGASAPQIPGVDADELMNTAKRLVDFYVARNGASVALAAAPAAVPAAAPAVGRRQKAVASNAPAKRQRTAPAPAAVPIAAAAEEPVAPAVGRRQKAVAVAAEETVAEAEEPAVGRQQKAIAAEEPVAAAEDDEIVGVPSPVQGPKVWLLCGRFVD